MKRSDRIQAWMKRENLSYADAARILGCDAGTVWKWRQPDGDKIKPMALLRQKLERILRKSESSIPADEGTE